MVMIIGRLYMGCVSSVLPSFGKASEGTAAERGYKWERRRNLFVKGTLQDKYHLDNKFAACRDKILTLKNKLSSTLKFGHAEKVNDAQAPAEEPVTTSHENARGSLNASEEAEASKCLDERHINSKTSESIDKVSGPGFSVIFDRSVNFYLYESNRGNDFFAVC